MHQLSRKPALSIVIAFLILWNFVVLINTWDHNVRDGYFGGLTPDLLVSIIGTSFEDRRGKTYGVAAAQLICYFAIAGIFAFHHVRKTLAATGRTLTGVDRERRYIRVAAWAGFCLLAFSVVNIMFAAIGFYAFDAIDGGAAGLVPDVT